MNERLGASTLSFVSLNFSGRKSSLWFVLKIHSFMGDKRTMSFKCFNLSPESRCLSFEGIIKIKIFSINVL